jgi:hypothetical protein
MSKIHRPKNKNNVIIAGAVIVGALMIVGAMMFSGGGSNGGGDRPLVDSAVGTDGKDSGNVSVADGQQTIAIAVKGGYSPKVTYAKAGLPTILRMETNGTFDCSAALVLPGIGVRNMLRPSGTTDFRLTADQAKGTFQGMCAMGMYGFKVVFE